MSDGFGRFLEYGWWIIGLLGVLTEVMDALHPERVFDPLHQPWIAMAFLLAWEMRSHRHVREELARVQLSRRGQ